ncbi:MAG: hypothetical protein E7091_07870 [Bacteroidales bacterium]|nr:hypothetical protein [Bacteroidales bacterium]
MKRIFTLVVVTLQSWIGATMLAQTTDNLLHIAGLEPDLSGQTTYYLKNVGTGLYMSYGGEWGTHCIETQQAHPIVVEDNEDGTVAIGSIGGYLESNTLWMDSTKTASKWTLVKVEGYENQYYLYGDGNRVLTSVGNSAGLLTLNTLADKAMQRWIFTNGADIKNSKMPNASEETPFDVTVSIRGGAFDLVDGWGQGSNKNVPAGIKNSTSLPDPYFGNWENYAANSKWLWDCGTRDWDPNVYAWCGIINGGESALEVTYSMTLPKGSYYFSFEGFYKYMKVVSEQKQKNNWGTWKDDGSPTITTTDNGTMNASVSIAGQSFALKSYGSDNSIYDNGALAAAVLRDNDTYEHHCTFYVSEESQKVSIVITKPATTATTSKTGSGIVSRTVTTTSYPSQIYIDDFTLLYYGEEDVTSTLKENANYTSYLNANIAEYKAQFNDEGDAAFDEAFTVNINNVVTRADYYNVLATLEEARKAGVLAHNRAEIQKEAIESGNFTDAIYNHSFELGTTEGWTVLPSQDTNVYLDTHKDWQGNLTYQTAGVDGRYLFNTWWQGTPITQTITGLPNGVYKMSVLVASGDAGNDATVYLLANDEKLGVNPPSGGKTFADFNLKFTVTDGTATIGVVGGNDDDTPENPVGSYNPNGHWWYKCDNFRLEYLADDHLQLDQMATTIDNLNETYKKVTINRPVKANTWSTFVVPFDIPAEDIKDWEVKALSSSVLNGDRLTLTFTDVEDGIKAGVPYMVRMESKLDKISREKVAVNTGTLTTPATEHIEFVGTYTNGNVPKGCFFISNNVFYCAADETNTLKGFRAYFRPIGDAVGKARSMSFRWGNDVTDIDKATEEVTIVAIYTINGVRLTEMQPGINILQMSDGSIVKVMVK